MPLFNHVKGESDRQYIPAKLVTPGVRVPNGIYLLWLNSGVPATNVAERAGQSVEVLLKIYAKCIDGDEEIMNKRIEDGLNGG